MSDTLAPEFLALVKSEYEEVRKRHFNRLFATATADYGELPGYDADFRWHYLDAALQFGAKEMAVALRELVQAGHTPLRDRARAAVLYLRGAKAGWWKITPKETEQARALIAAHYGSEERMTPAPTAKEKTKADLAREAGLPTEDVIVKKKTKRSSAKDKEDMKRTVAICQACAKFERAFKEASNGAEKLSAIQTWFAAMDYLAPEEMRPEKFRAAFAKVKGMSQ